MKKVKSKNNFNIKSGYIMLLTAIIFMMVSIVIIFGISTPIIKQIFASRDIWNAKQSYYLSEAGIEDVMYRLKDGAMSAKVGPTEDLILDGYSVITQITGSLNGKTITALSDQNGYKKTIEAKVIQGSGTSFNYGILAGNGGSVITGGSSVIGNIYSNGDILGGSGVHITGSAIAASSAKVFGNEGNYFFIGSTSTDMAWASDVSHTSLIGNLYCLSGTNNAGEKTCDTSKGIPDTMPMPISEADIDQWKTEAIVGGTHNGNLIVGWDGDIIGPIKITGNLTVSGGGTLMVTGTIWVQGNIILTGGGKIKISPTLGSNSVVIVADGYVKVDGGGQFEGSGTIGSYPVVVSTSICPNKTPCTTNSAAISISGGAGAVVLNAPFGKVSINGGSGARSVCGDSIYISGGGIVTYEAGLASLSFSSGPSGSWVISGWKELEN